MRIEKEKRKVNIICDGGTSLKGIVHINPGQRLIDFLNNSEENFIAVTEAKFGWMAKNKKLIILNKTSIKLIEEILS